MATTTLPSPEWLRDSDLQAALDWVGDPAGAMGRTRDPWQTDRGAAPPVRLAQPSLTAREREVMRWLAAGKTDRDIGAILAISHRTVHKHLQNVYAKLGVETRTAAVMRALQASLH